MAISESYSGTQTATVSTEHTLNTTTPETADGIYQFFVDVANLAAASGTADVVELRVKEKVISGGTQRTVFVAVLQGTQGADSGCWCSPALVLLHGWDFTLKQTAGTGRSFPWSIRKVA